MSVNPEIVGLVVWLDRTIKRVPYGEAVIKVTMHGGKAVLVEKSSTEKIQLVEQPRGGEK
jgi:hypothetical protein